MSRRGARGWLGAGALLLWLAAGPASAEPAYLDLYGALLRHYTAKTDAVVGTRVDYVGLKRDPRWPELVARFSGSRPSALASREQRLAFWINAYNIFTIDLIVANLPVESIRDLGSFFSPVWKEEVGQLEGRPHTLHEIEHEILRPMGEPRIHAAIACASVSCPPLQREPFRADALDRQLEQATRAWLASPDKGARLEKAEQRLYLSRIFKWFAGDFEAGGGVVEFVVPRLEASDAQWIRSHRDTLGIRYLDYDWSLND